MHAIAICNSVPHLGLRCCPCCFLAWKDPMGPWGPNIYIYTHKMQHSVPPLALRCCPHCFRGSSRRQRGQQLGPAWQALWPHFALVIFWRRHQVADRPGSLAGLAGFSGVSSSPCENSASSCYGLKTTPLNPANPALAGVGDTELLHLGLAVFTHIKPQAIHRLALGFGQVVTD